MKVNIYYYVAILLLLTVLIPLSIVHADSETENIELLRIINILNSVSPLIDEAQRQQDKSARVQFEYEALRGDLTKIKTGIQEKLNTPSIEPRKATPIQGDYLIQYKN